MIYKIGDVLPIKELIDSGKIDILMEVSEETNWGESPQKIIIGDGKKYLFHLTSDLVIIKIHDLINLNIEYIATEDIDYDIPQSILEYHNRLEIFSKTGFADLTDESINKIADAVSNRTNISNQPIGKLTTRAGQQNININISFFESGVCQYAIDGDTIEDNLDNIIKSFIELYNS